MRFDGEYSTFWSLFYFILSHRLKNNRIGIVIRSYVCSARNSYSIESTNPDDVNEANEVNEVNVRSFERMEERIV